MRVWDTTTSSAVRSSCCVRKTSVIDESLLYVAAGSSVATIDLRTMQRVITTAIGQHEVYSFDIVRFLYGKTEFVTF